MAKSDKDTDDTNDKDDKTMMKFRLLSGVHGQFEETDEKDNDGNPIRVHRSYAAGTKQDIVPNTEDLVAMFGQQRFERLPDDTEVPPAVGTQAAIPGQTRDIPDNTAAGLARQEAAKKAEEENDPKAKTAKAGPAKESTAKSETEPKLHKAELDAMTVEELRDHARSHDINLHGASTKDDIVAAIRRNK